MKAYMDTTLDSSSRAALLLSELSLEEKVAQLQCMMVVGDPAFTLSHFEHGVGEISVMSPFGTAADVAGMNRATIDYVMERAHGIPPIIHVEALSGVQSPEATVFPSAIGMGATFDPNALEQTAEVIREQMLAVGFRRALSPVMDVARDPRWGRIGETYGEDPTLCARMSVAYTKGLQGNHKDGAAATAKHFLGYGKSEGGLNIASNSIPPRELREVYAKPFQAAISNSSLMSVMNSYGKIDGEMIIDSPAILTGLLRDEMKFEGAVVSDYKSLDKMLSHHLHANAEEAGIAALEAGLDVECPMPKGYTESLITAVREGRLDERLIDRAVMRVLWTKFELGLFESPYPREETLESCYGSPAAREKSLEMARKSIVLLKNDGTLPLPRKGRKIAVIGPHADSLRLMFGGYTYPASTEMRLARSMSEMEGVEDYGSKRLSKMDDNFVQSDPFPGSTVLKQHPLVTKKLQEMYGDTTPTLLASLRAASEHDIVYAKGCDLAGNDRSGFAEAVSVARSADVVIIAVGGKYGWGKHCTVGEGIDADTLGLPGVQAEMASVLMDTGKPCIIVHMDVRPLSDVYLHERAAAALECWFPGITGGQAIAETIFGINNPAGRMPVTTARHVGQIPIYCGHLLGDSYDSSMVLSRYCDSTLEPLYYFGHGLSYTTFEYTDLSVDAAEQCIRISCRVTNTGGCAGDEVVQLYVTDDLASMMRPARELAGFKRIHLEAGESCKVEFICAYSQFAFLNKKMEWIIEKGSMHFAIGPSSKVIALQGSFDIPDGQVIEGNRRAFYAKERVTK